MPEITGKHYTVRLSKTDGTTSRVEVQDLAWRGFDSRRWRFSDWPDERVIREILIAYRPVDPLVESWFVTTIDIDRRYSLFTTKGKAVAKALSPNYINAVVSIIDGVAEYEQLGLDF